MTKLPKYLAGLVAVAALGSSLTGTAGALVGNGGQPTKAARCVDQIATVIDAEHAGYIAQADRIIESMSDRCLTIGADAEDHYNAGWSNDRIIAAMYEDIALEYRTTETAIANAYCRMYGC